MTSRTPSRWQVQPVKAWAQVRRPPPAARLVACATIQAVTEQRQRYYEWADDLPEQCPPAAAVPASGGYYRVVKTLPLTERDFRRPRDLPRTEPFPPDKMCQASALSLYGDLTDAQRALVLVPGFRKRRLAVGTLNPICGVTQVTPSRPPHTPEILKSHTSWWVPTNIAPNSLFEAVDDE
jgi:hypothetical protein